MIWCAPDPPDDGLSRNKSSSLSVCLSLSSSVLLDPLSSILSLLERPSSSSRARLSNGICVFPVQKKRVLLLLLLFFFPSLSQKEKAFYKKRDLSFSLSLSRVCVCVRLGFSFFCLFFPLFFGTFFFFGHTRKGGRGFIILHSPPLTKKFPLIFERRAPKGNFCLL